MGTEVATLRTVKLALEYDIDVLWVEPEQRSLLQCKKLQIR
jgi:hypothetical protein